MTDKLEVDYRLSFVNVTTVYNTQKPIIIQANKDKTSEIYNLHLRPHEALKLAGLLMAQAAELIEYND